MAVSAKQMRDFWKSTVASLMLTVLVFASGAHAQSFSSYVAFGDSYADTGNLEALLRQYGTPTQVNQFLAMYPTGRFSGGTNYVDDLAALYGLKPTNYAIGGATTGLAGYLGSSFSGLTTEMQQFALAGGTISPNALVTMNIGGNDARYYYQANGTLAGVPAAAAVSATNATNAINTMVAAGARTLVFSIGNVGTLPETVNYPTNQVAVGAAYSTTYNTLMQANLAPVAAKGVNVVWLDLNLVLARIQSNMSAFGFTSVACTLACVGNTALQNQNVFYADGIHLTSAGFQVMANYIASEIAAPQTLASAGNVGSQAAQGFAGTLLGRLDLVNGPSSGAGAPLSYAEDKTPEALAKVKPGVQASPWSVFMQGVGATGSSSVTTTSSGYSWSSLGGDFGVEYRVSPEIVFGGAFEYTRPQLSLSGGMGSTTVDSWQFGGFGGYTGRNIFLQGLVAAGRLGFTDSRQGVLGNITASPSGSDFVGAFKAGYLFDIDATTRLGPIAGLTLAHVGVDAYSESGDPALTLAVDAQNVDTALGAIGAQARKSFATPAGRFDAFLNLTAEDNFSGGNRSVGYAQTDAPLIVDTLNLVSPSNRIFGRGAAGLSSSLTSRVSVTASVSRTVGQPGGDTTAGSVGISFAF